ncbi:MAG TPA: cupin domain-containing protein, partial [Gemmatimonadota bacterium]|nr:cupin domain-containing protein [Gemmatimonadota bacterium]
MRCNSLIILTLGASFLFFAAPAGLAQEVAPGANEPGEHVFVAEGDIEYAPIDVPGFDPGMRIAAVHGDPAGTSDYIIRLAFPDGYRFPSHWHPKAEHVTVLEGTFLLAMDTGGEAAEPESYGPGDFLYIPGEHPHYGGAEGETVI